MSSGKHIIHCFSCLSNAQSVCMWFWRCLLQAFGWVRWLSISIKEAFTGAERFGGDLFQPACYGTSPQRINAFSLVSSCCHSVALLIGSKGERACHQESKQGSDTNTLTLVSNCVASAAQSVSAGKWIEKPKSTHNPVFFTRLLAARIDITGKLKKNGRCSDASCWFDFGVNS